MKYRTILVDPPWEYTQKLKSSATRGGVKYRTMSLDEISNIAVPDWADKDCQCWLWTTNAHHHNAFHILDAWGFKYITTATWVKTRFGLGYWLRGVTEHLLLGIKGSPRGKLVGPHGAIGSNWSTLIYQPVIYASPRKHSEKPDAAYDMIESISEEPRLELFGTKYRMGWYTMGDEVGREITQEKEGTNEV